MCISIRNLVLKHPQTGIQGSAVDIPACIIHRKQIKRLVGTPRRGDKASVDAGG